MSLLQYFSQNDAPSPASDIPQSLDELSSCDEAEGSSSSEDECEIAQPKAKKLKLHSYSNGEKAQIVKWLEESEDRTAVDAAKQFKVVARNIQSEYKKFPTFVHAEDHTNPHTTNTPHTHATHSAIHTTHATR